MMLLLRSTCAQSLLQDCCPTFSAHVQEAVFYFMYGFWGRLDPQRLLTSPSLMPFCCSNTNLNRQTKRPKNNGIIFAAAANLVLIDAANAAAVATASAGAAVDAAGSASAAASAAAAAAAAAAACKRLFW